MFSTQFNNVKVVPQNQFVVIPVGENEPYQAFCAAPLITCFGYLFMYETNAGAQKMILYHATSGDLDEGILSKILDEIDKDSNSRLTEVKVALSGDAKDPMIIKLLSTAKHRLHDHLDDVDKQFQVVTEFMPSYSADTRGRHGVSADALCMQEEKARLDTLLTGLKTLLSDNKWNNMDVGFLSLWSSTPKPISQLRDILAKTSQNHYENLKLYRDASDIIRNISLSSDSKAGRQPALNELYESLAAQLQSYETNVASKRTSSPLRRQ